MTQIGLIFWDGGETWINSKRLQSLADTIITFSPKFILRVISKSNLRGMADSTLCID